MMILTLSVYYLRLTYNFYTVKVFNEDVFIITELEILKLDKVTFTITNEYELPDLFEEIVIYDGRIEFKCTGGQRIFLT